MLAASSSLLAAFTVLRWYPDQFKCHFAALHPMKQVAKIDRRTSNRSKDFLHKKSAAITRRNVLISVESLSMRGMARGLKLGKSVHDNEWGIFVNMLEYKQGCIGQHLIKVDCFVPAAQLSSGCSEKNQA